MTLRIRLGFGLRESSHVGRVQYTPLVRTVRGIESVLKDRLGWSTSSGAGSGFAISECRRLQFRKAIMRCRLRVCNGPSRCLLSDIFT